MKLTSPAFDHGGKIPAKYTCDGENINPPLTISDVPTEARSMVLIMDDPDVPKQLREDGMWDHWVVFNIPASLRDIREGKEPRGTHGTGTGGNLNYYGPAHPIENIGIFSNFML
jgi:Raf kinase inhibitor-like YbhB/YbcL family protein